MDDDQAEPPVYEAPQVEPAPPTPDLTSQRATRGDCG